MATKNINKSKYYLYIDECGDHQLEKFNPNFPIFTLCGFLVPGDKIETLEAAVKDFKREFRSEEHTSELQSQR